MSKNDVNFKSSTPFPGLEPDVLRQVRFLVFTRQTNRYLNEELGFLTK